MKPSSAGSALAAWWWWWWSCCCGTGVRAINPGGFPNAMDGAIRGWRSWNAVTSDVTQDFVLRQVCTRTKAGVPQRGFLCGRRKAVQVVREQRMLILPLVGGLYVHRSTLFRSVSSRQRGQQGPFRFLIWDLAESGSTADGRLAQRVRRTASLGCRV